MMKKIGIMLLAILIVIALYLLCDYNGILKSGEPIAVRIPNGSGAIQIADLLKENHVIRSKTLFVLYAKKEDPAFQSGMHVFEGKSYRSIIETLETQPSSDYVTLTFPEGIELRQIKEMVVEAGLCDAESFDKALDPALYDYAFLKDLPARENRLEGYLFPDTYDFSYEEGARSIIGKMLANFDKKMTKERLKQVENSEFSLDEIITLASIVEREAADESEFPLVAGVFYNRLHRVGESNGMLESCATVQYILKERKTVLSVADTQIDSPYNTYRYDGLPIGPIASPGTAAIDAVLWPESTDYLYFVADGNGNHYFSKTFTEHQENMRKAGLL